MRSTAAAQLPAGTVTFMFTDIEGSTGLLDQLGPDRYARLLRRHNDVIRGVLTQSQGTEVSTEGDAFFAVFVDVSDALGAAARIQRELADTQWEDGVSPRVRIGLHTGEAIQGGDNYVGIDVHEAQRVSSSGHGGQILISNVTAQAASGHLAEGLTVKPLGRYRLAGFTEPARLHQVVGPGLDEAFPPLRSPRAESRLPASLTDFVGREQEIEAVGQTLENHRLLTLTGPGGTGKTRLAIELARRIEERFSDGAYFVALASLTDPGLIPATVLEAMEVPLLSAVDPSERLVSHLAERDVLLILDNYEQLLEGVSIVARLLDAAHRLRLLITSRSPLHVQGEREFPVAPLGVPDERDDRDQARLAPGVKLFVSRATAVRPDFVLDDHVLDAVAEITRALDGLPLAIELAASRVRAMTPDVIRERLNNQLLSTPGGDLPSRQQTIANTIRWSYELLDPAHRALFESLSVFSGSFGLIEAEGVCPSEDVLDGITALVEQSLLRQADSQRGSRYRMLTVIREFGQARLAESGLGRETSDRHCAVYVQLAESAGLEILTSRQGDWLERLHLDHDNLRAAFDHAVTIGDGETAQRLVAALWRFWQIRGHLDEAHDRATAALALPDADDPRVRARALTALSGIRYWQGRWPETLEPSEQALELMRQVDDEAETAEALYNLSFPVGYLGDTNHAEELLKEALEIDRRLGRQVGVGRVLWGLSNLAAYREDWTAVADGARQAADVLTTVDAPYDLGWAWFMVTYGSARAGRDKEAKLALAKALEIFASVTDLSAFSLIFEAAALLALRSGDRMSAAYVLGATHRLRAETGIEIGEIEINQYEELNAFLDTFDPVELASFQEGKTAPVDEAAARVSRALS